MYNLLYLLYLLHRCWKSRFIFTESLEDYSKNMHKRGKLLEQSFFFFPIAKDASSTDTGINWLNSVLTGVTV